MSLKKWLHTVNEKYFGYRSLLKKLVKEGKDDTVTDDEVTGIRLVTTLYLDADMHFYIELPEGADFSQISEDQKTRHLDLLSEKIAHIEKFFYQSVALGGFVGFIAPFLVNYLPYVFDYDKLIDDLYALITSSAISVGMVVFRKKVGPFIMRQIAARLFSVRFKGIEFNKEALQSG